MTFRQRLLEAAKAGIINAVTWGLTIAIIATLSYGVIADYFATRQQAAHGEEAYQYLVKLSKQQQKQVPQASPPAK